MKSTVANRLAHESYSILKYYFTLSFSLRHFFKLNAIINVGAPLEPSIYHFANDKWVS